MKCPNCRCIVTDNCHKCQYCGYVFDYGSTKTVGVYDRNGGCSKTVQVQDGNFTARSDYYGGYSSNRIAYSEDESLSPFSPLLGSLLCAALIIVLIILLLELLLLL